MSITKENIQWLGQAGFCITASKTVYIDPFKIKDGLALADVILITHAHYDHCSVEDIKKVAAAGTVIYAPPDCNLKGVAGKIIAVSPNKDYSGEGYKLHTVPAYNINKQFHPKSKNWVGYVLSIDSVTIYHAGDTDNIPEMKGLKPTYALLPVGGTYTMTADEAAAAFKATGGAFGIPMHYGSVVGTPEDGKRFLKLIGQEK